MLLQNADVGCWLRLLAIIMAVCFRWFVLKISVNKKFSTKAQNTACIRSVFGPFLRICRMTIHSALEMKRND